MVGLADFHHIEFSVANASQSAYWFCCSFGFHRFARRENDKLTSVAIRNNQVKFVFTSRKIYSDEERRHFILHGDSVLDVAFRVDDLKSIIQETDVLHNLIELETYRGCFLPEYEEVEDFAVGRMLKTLPICRIDHVVQNYHVDSIEETAAWYKKALALNRFWSADDLVAKTQYTAITAWLLVNESRKVQYTIAETVKGHPGRSQIQEFVDFNGGSGIQHIALLVDNIVEAVVAMRERSVEFLYIPDAYYEILKQRLEHSKLDFEGDIELLKKHKILMDFDDNGYLLQIFTKPVQDKPTLFFEIIQRKNFNGFGAGNFKSLFEAVEREQKIRGTL